MQELKPEEMGKTSGGLIVKAGNRYIVHTDDGDLYYRDKFFEDLESAKEFARSRGYSTKVMTREEFVKWHGETDVF